MHDMSARKIRYSILRWMKRRNEDDEKFCVKVAFLSHHGQLFYAGLDFLSLSSLQQKGAQRLARLSVVPRQLVTSVNNNPKIPTGRKQGTFWLFLQ